MNKNQILNLILSAFAVLLIASCEFLPHPMNFVPVTAAAIFSGIYINRRFAIVLPLTSLLVADMIQGISWIDVPFVYGSVAMAAVLGGLLKKDRSNATTFAPKVLGAAIGSSVIFFVVTNFGVWLFQNMYTKDFQGFVQCYVMAIPFFKNALAGDLLFVSVFVGSYELLSRALQARTGSSSVNATQ